MNTPCNPAGKIEKLRRRDKYVKPPKEAMEKGYSLWLEILAINRAVDYSFSIPPLNGAGGAKNLNNPDNKKGSL